MKKCIVLLPLSLIVFNTHASEHCQSPALHYQGRRPVTSMKVRRASEQQIAIWQQDQATQNELNQEEQEEISPPQGVRSLLAASHACAQRIVVREMD